MSELRHPSRVLIAADVGGSDARHVGDEAMLLGLLDSVTRDDLAVHWCVVASMPAAVSTQFGVDSVPSFGFEGCETIEAREQMLAQLDAVLVEPIERWGSVAPAQWAETLRAVVASDALIIAGGGNLSHSWPALVCERVALVRACRRAGHRVVVTGQTLGPFFGTRTRQLVQEILRACDVVGVREHHSVNVARSLGVPSSKIRLCFDDAVSLTSTAPAGASAAPWAGSFIAVTLNTYARFEPDSEPVKALGRQLLDLAAETGARIVFVPHVGGRGSNRERDSEVVDRLVALDPHETHFVSQPLPSPREAVWYCAHAAMVISTRYHPIVFGTAAATPSLFMWQDGYTRAKGEGALNLVGQLRWSISLGEACSGGLLQVARQLWKQKDEVRIELLGRRLHIRDASAQHLTSLMRTMLTGDGDRPALALDIDDPSAQLLPSLIELADLGFDEADRAAAASVAATAALEHRFAVVEDYALSLERRSVEAERYAGELERALQAKTRDLEIAARRLAELEG